MGQWVYADSDAIDGFHYDETAHTLRVRFTSGGVYDYFDTPPRLYQRLMRANSKGHFFTTYIRDKLAFRKVH